MYIINKCQQNAWNSANDHYTFHGNSTGKSCWAHRYAKFPMRVMCSMQEVKVQYRNDVVHKHLRPNMRVVKILPNKLPFGYLLSWTALVCIIKLLCIGSSKVFLSSIIFLAPSHQHKKSSGQAAKNSRETTERLHRNVQLAAVINIIIINGSQFCAHVVWLLI